jgi:hypothetical protein
MLRLILRPHLEPGGFHTDRFDAYLDSELIVGPTRQPWYDAARALLARGYPPDALLTMRHEKGAQDSFVPRPIGALAELTVEESDRSGLRVRKYRSFPGGRLKDEDSARGQCKEAAE